MISFVFMIGGIGFFLLGMDLITKGLKSLAGDTLRKWLNRFTGGKLSAISTGTVLTLLIQSSTATTLMTIGFVSAGMLTLLQAVGVIFGANLGTTSIGWIVSFIGLKFSISEFALPLIGIGMLLKQFSKGIVAYMGTVLSGFGLLFVGIQFLQDGMADLSHTIDLSNYAGDSIGSLFILVFIGIIMTIIMQSSGAAIATTITVLASGVISFEQAALLVIGQNIGTTATAAFAALGASVPAKRTALAHILFNVSTGIIVLFTFPLIMMGMNWISEQLQWNDPAVLLALFHTFFSLLGIVIFAPLMTQFVRLLVWMLPEKKSPITKYLDDSVVGIPSVAIETAWRAIKEATKLTLHQIIGKLTALTQPNSNQQTIEKFDQELLVIQKELDAIHQFLEEIQETPKESSAHYIALLHALDHLERMNRLTVNVSSYMDSPRLKQSNQAYPTVLELLSYMHDCLEAIDQSKLHDMLYTLKDFSEDLATFRRQKRVNIFDGTAKGKVTVPDAFNIVQLISFVDGLAFHLWRIFHHLSAGSIPKKELEKTQPEQEQRKRSETN